MALTDETEELAVTQTSGVCKSLNRTAQHDGSESARGCLQGREKRMDLGKCWPLRRKSRLVSGV